MIIGSWLRLMINVNYIFVLVGQFFGALGFTIIRNCNSKLCYAWFSESKVIFRS